MSDMLSISNIAWWAWQIVIHIFACIGLFLMWSNDDEDPCPRCGLTIKDLFEGYRGK